MAAQYIYALGRRKSSVATVKLLSKGSGKHTLTHGDTTVDLKQYFGGNQALYQNAIAPLMVLGGDYFKMFDATIIVRGGGSRGQSDAIKLSFARALTEFNDELKPMLKPFSLLKRDPRIKERKKPGLKKARKAPRRSKR